MESSSSTPSASSHASSIVRAALRTPIPSPATPSPARCAGAYEITSPNSAWDEAITSPAPPPNIIYMGWQTPNRALQTTKQNQQRKRRAHCAPNCARSEHRRS
ncbi:hypothetical protein B0H13DRAFT_1901651, partial [Mycena leptocephala]